MSCYVVEEDNFSGDIWAYWNDFGSGDLENQTPDCVSKNKAQITPKDWPDQAIADLSFVPTAPPVVLFWH